MPLYPPVPISNPDTGSYTYIDSEGVERVAYDPTFDPTTVDAENATTKMADHILAGTNMTITESSESDSVVLSSYVGAISDSRFVLQTGDQTVNGTTSFTDITGMALTIGANETWYAEFHIFYKTGTSGDIKFGATWPAGCVIDVMSLGGGLAFNVDTGNAEGRWHAIRPASSGDLIAAHGGNVGSAGNAPIPCIVCCFIRNGSTAGVFQLQFAQLVSDGTDTSVYGASGSTNCGFMEARRLA